MPRGYSVGFDAVAISAAQDLFEITPADDKPIRIAGLLLSNVGGVADAGDAQEELLRLAIIRGFTASGSGGSAATPVPLGTTVAAVGFAAEVNNAGLATTGSTTQPFQDGWNIRIPYQMFFPEELMIGAGQGNTSIVVRLVTAPADAVTCSGTLFVIEEG